MAIMKKKPEETSENIKILCHITFDSAEEPIVYLLVIVR